MKVYVRWYGKVLQGELLDGESMGMKQVRIPLDGHHPIALFAPGHVYDSLEQVTEKSSIKHTNSQELCTKTQEKYTKQPKIEQQQPKIEQQQPKIEQQQPKIEQQQPKIEHIDPAPADDRQILEAFKQANWDHDRNHLRIDKLDEFYQLWRMVMTPFGFAEAKAVHNSCTPKLHPQPTKKREKVNIIQLSLF